MKPHHLHQLLSIFALANITCGASNLDVLAKQQRHRLVYVVLATAAHHDMGSPLTQGLSCSQTDSDGKDKRCVENGSLVLHTPILQNIHHETAHFSSFN